MMKRKISTVLGKLLIGVFLGAGLHTASAQSMEWAKAFGDNAIAIKTAADTAGSVYITGYFGGGATDFDPGPGVTSLTPTGWDIFLLKLNADGEFVWVKHFEGEHMNGGGEPRGITVDVAGNIYLTGVFGSFQNNDLYTMSFSPGNSNFDLTSSGADFVNYFVDRDIFVVKLNNQGDLQWARKIGEEGENYTSSIATDTAGNVLLAGRFEAATDFDPGAGSYILTPPVSNNADAFVCKLDHNGDYVWARQFGGAGSSITTSAVSADETGNVYAMGSFLATVDFDPGPGTFNLTTGVSAQSWDVMNTFISKLDTAGNFVWARNMGDLPPGGAVTQFLQPMGMALDKTDGIYITGIFNDTSDMDPGPGTSYIYPNGESDVFLVRLDTSGSFTWARSFGGSNYESSWGLRTDDWNNVYCIGRYKGLVDFDPSDTGDFIVTSLSAQGGLFVSKFDSSGNFIRVSAIDAAGNGSIGLNGMGFALSPLDYSIYAVSDFTQTVDFDPGPDTFNISAPNGNAFVVKLKNCNPIGSELTITACDSFTLNGTTYMQSGVYQQSYPAVSGCDSVVTLALTISQAPDLSVTKTGNTLNAVSSGAVYQWIDCDNGNQEIPGADQQSFSPDHNGSYAVVISRNSCTDTSDCVLVDGITAIDTYDRLQHTVRLYPNPAKARITLKATKALQQATIRIITPLGQCVAEERGIKGTSHTISLERLSAGIYFVEVRQQKAVTRIKIVKE